MTARFRSVTPGLVALLTVALIAAVARHVWYVRPAQALDSLLRQSELPPESMVGSALSRPLPDYPEPSLRNGADGVAVALVQADEEGWVKEVVVLQSPDEHTGLATKAALEQWRFGPAATAGGRPVAMRGRVVVYFSIEEGVGRVTAPQRSPTVNQPLESELSKGRSGG